MPEPLNPSDHDVAVRGLDMPLDCVSGGDCEGRPDMYVPWSYKLALHEAIHQTFERDALNVAWVNSQIERQDQERREWADSGAVGEIPNSELRTTPDPDTEIDRQARLIVDGEYRRRAEAKGANNA